VQVRRCPKVWPGVAGRGVGSNLPQDFASAYLPLLYKHYQTKGGSATVLFDQKGGVHAGLVCVLTWW
jgi:hypothetical protein